jgi:hypothetical protein
MAIYESKGRRVQLESREIQRGFRPENVYDPTKSLGEAASQRIQAAGESAREYSNQLSQLSRDYDALGQQNVEALSNFSETLSKFIVDRQEKYNENQKNLGIADILNGKTELNPKLLNKYEQDRTYLEKAKDAEVQVISEVEKVDPAFAESLYQESKPLAGWRGYGQAIGKAMMGTGQIRSFFSNFLESDEPMQVVVGGKTQTFTPRTAKTREQLEAVWEVGTQKFLQTSGLSQINPVILAEHVTPVMVRARGELLGNKMEEIIQVRKSNQLEDKRAEIYAGKENFKDRNLAQSELLRLNSWLTDFYGGDRTKANEATNEMMTHLIRVTASDDLASANQIFNNYRDTLLNPKDTKLGTYGSRYDLTDLATFLDKTSDKNKEEVDNAAKEEADGIVKVHYANPSQRSYNEAMRRLQKLQESNPSPGVLAAIDDLQRRGPNWNPTREQEYVNSARSLGELEALKAAGYISQDGYDRGALNFKAEQDFTKLLPSGAESIVRGQIRDQVQDQLGTTEQGFEQKSQSAVNAITGLARAAVLAKAKQAAAAGRPYTALDAQRDFDNEVKNLLKSGDFVRFTKQGNLTKVQYSGSPLSNKTYQSTVGVATSNRGTGLDLVNTAISRVPRTTSAVKDVVLGPDRISLAIDVLKSGGQAPSDVDFAAKTAGVSVPEYLRRQSQRPEYSGTPFDINELGQGAQNYRDNYAISPRHANILANPRSTPDQRRQATRELNRIRNSQTLPPEPIRELTSFKRQVSSVNYENYVPGRKGAQPGLDIFFEDKKFPVVLDGVVKDKGYEAGYGNYVVIESIDPETGDKVDVLYGHLASRSPLALNSSVTAGQLVGTQGGTGNVQSADGTIASIDFLAPAPRGSGSMKPYRNYDRLRRRIGATFGY